MAGSPSRRNPLQGMWPAGPHGSSIFRSATRPGAARQPVRSRDSVYYRPV